MIDKAHDKKPPKDLDEGHKVFTDEELKQIKDSLPKHEMPIWKCPKCGYEYYANSQYIEQPTTELPLATLDVMEHNARHTKP